VGIGGFRMRALELSIAVGLVGLLGASPAAAATQIGETVPNPDLCAATTALQSASPGNSYAAPNTGIITQWSFQAGPTPPAQIRLKIARPLGGNSFAIVGESSFVAPGASTLSSFATRISVQTGDVLGLFTPSTAAVCRSTAPAEGFASHHAGNPGPDVPVGTTMTFFGPFNSPQLDVSARLEPDADNDGFGDETQDACPADAALQEAPCDRTAPTAQLTKTPRDKIKTKKKKAKATFAFGGSDARVIAEFQCSVDDAPFASCTSPYTVKVKKGKHTFQVRAVDQAGNVGSPTTDTWKVKKKKKK
jgi:hypothetical protein